MPAKIIKMGIKTVQPPCLHPDIQQVKNYCPSKATSNRPIDTVKTKVS